MPAFIPEFNSAGMKWVGGYPENFKKELPYITGLLILNDTLTGVPYAIMDCAWITAIRTAAATALTARYLARSDSRTLAILGCGVQGRYNLETLNSTFDLSTIKIFDISDATVQCYQKAMTRRLGLNIEIAKSPEQAVADADIVVTAGPFLIDPNPIIEYEWIKPGAFICPLDLDSYLKPEIFTRSTFLSTDDLKQFQHFKKSGLFKTCPEAITDLGDIITGKVEGRKTQNDVITSINIGIALEDMAVAPLVYQKALKNTVGFWLDL
jgi:ornithine cyclodeaminase/alanine dehydrogenase